MVEHAFRSVKRVNFIVGPENRRSQRAMEKIGGMRAETRIDAHGRERVVYEFTPELFARRQGSGPKIGGGCPKKSNQLGPFEVKTVALRDTDAARQKVPKPVPIQPFNRSAPLPKCDLSLDDLRRQIIGPVVIIIAALAVVTRHLKIISGCQR